MKQQKKMKLSLLKKDKDTTRDERYFKLTPAQGFMEGMRLSSFALKMRDAKNISKTGRKKAR